MAAVLRESGVVKVVRTRFGTRGRRRREVYQAWIGEGKTYKEASYSEVGSVRVLWIQPLR